MKKRIFLGLLLGSLVVIFTITIVLGLVAKYNDNFFNQLVIFFGMLAIAFLILIGFGLLCLIIAIWRAKVNSSLLNLILSAVNILFPISLSLGKILHVKQESIKKSFIAVNNELVKNQNLNFSADDLLILAPHCLQWSKCPYKITLDVNNCHRCGKCSVDFLHEIRDKYGVKFIVVSGGTLARKFVKELRPKGIVAIACEQDLTSGIQETSPLPVLGILNLRPNGPCYNTDLDRNLLEKAVVNFLYGKAEVENYVEKGQGLVQKS
ncbi:MAG: DUF116 domain-containing protein [Zhaonellaceae bacterium]|nr:DUF116 domain-containing protein [Clostridia bacterium]